MPTILVPLDGSELADRAIPFAVRLARSTGAQLLLVRAALAYLYESEGVSDIVRLDRSAEPGLAESATKIRTMGVTVDTHVAFGVSAADSIIGIARERTVDLIVMSSHGRGGIGRFVYGSVADRVLRNATVPVLLVTPGVHRVWKEGPIKVLVPLDGSALAARALNAVVTLAERLPLSVVLARIVEPPPPDAALGFPPTYAVPMPIDPAEQLEAARSALGREADRVRGQVSVASIRVEVGSVASTLLRLADEEKFDLIALSTHGRGGVTRLVMGSVATALTQRAQIPLLIVPNTVQARPVLTPTDPRRRPLPERDITLTLTPLQVGYVEYGLEMVLHSETDRGITEDVQSLLERIEGLYTRPA